MTSSLPSGFPHKGVPTGTYGGSNGDSHHRRDAPCHRVDADSQTSQAWALALRMGNEIARAVRTRTVRRTACLSGPAQSRPAAQHERWADDAPHHANDERAIVTVFRLAAVVAFLFLAVPFAAA